MGAKGGGFVWGVFSRKALGVFHSLRCVVMLVERPARGGRWGSNAGFGAWACLLLSVRGYLGVVFESCGFVVYG